MTLFREPPWDLGTTSRWVVDISFHPLSLSICCLTCFTKLLESVLHDRDPTNFQAVPTALTACSACLSVERYHLCTSLYKYPLSFARFPFVAFSTLSTSSSYFLLKKISYCSVLSSAVIFFISSSDFTSGSTILSKSDLILLSSIELSCFSIFNLVYNLSEVNWEEK